MSKSSEAKGFMNRYKVIYITIVILLLASIFCKESHAATITYTYDSLNRLTSVDYGNGATISYTYDAAGNRLTLVSTPPDLTPPTTPLVTDDGLYTTNLTQLQAVWASNDPETGIAEYQYAIGTTPQGTDVVGWTSTGTNNSVVQTGLSLLDSVTFYVSVKARSGAGLWSETGNSDGIMALSPAGDADGDGLTNDQEISNYRSDPLRADTDGDGFSDGTEVLAGTNPLDPASNPNRPPVVNAGADQNVSTGSSVTLDGSASSDPDGDLITFNWAQTYRPLDSIATLSDPTAPKPSFIADKDGYYSYDLTVCDYMYCSQPDSVTVYATTPNVPPNANAGPDQNVLTGLPVLLDGTVSNDPDSGPGPLSYLWGFMNVPQGSLLTNGNITGRDTPLASFVPDMSGDYQLDLSVSDGADTAYDQVIITAEVNVPPTANAGLDQVVILGQVVSLDGSGSYDQDGQPQAISYQWSFVSIPAGSGLTNSNITNANTISAGFTPDITGSYVIQLAVYDGQAVATDNMVVTVIQPKANSNGASSYFKEGGYNAYAIFDVKYQSGSTAPSGSLTFTSSKTRRKVVSTGIASLTVTGKTAVITGPCTLNGVSGYNFTATVVDNAIPGAGSDTFAITVTGPNGFNYMASGTIISGDYTVSR